MILSPILLYTPLLLVPAGQIAIDNGANPPEVVLSKTDVDALTYGGTLELLLVKDYVRVKVQDDPTVAAINSGSIGSLSGLREKILRNEKIINNAEGYAAALAELERITQGQFSINFTVRTTTEDWRPGQQFKLKIPAKTIVFMMNVNAVNTDREGTLSSGREEMLHKCTAQLSDADPLMQLANALKNQLSPRSRAKLRIVQ